MRSKLVLVTTALGTLSACALQLMLLSTTLAATVKVAAPTVHPKMPSVAVKPSVVVVKPNVVVKPTVVAKPVVGNGSVVFRGNANRVLPSNSGTPSPGVAVYSAKAGPSSSSSSSPGIAVYSAKAGPASSTPGISLFGTAKPTTPTMMTGVGVPVGAGQQGASGSQVVLSRNIALISSHAEQVPFWLIRDWHGDLGGGTSKSGPHWHHSWDDGDGNTTTSGSLPKAVSTSPGGGNIGGGRAGGGKTGGGNSGGGNTSGNGRGPPSADKDNGITYVIAAQDKDGNIVGYFGADGFVVAPMSGTAEGAGSSVSGTTNALPTTYRDVGTVIMDSNGNLSVNIGGQVYPLNKDGSLGAPGGGGSGAPPKDGGWLTLQQAAQISGESKPAESPTTAPSAATPGTPTQGGSGGSEAPPKDGGWLSLQQAAAISGASKSQEPSTTSPGTAPSSPSGATPGGTGGGGNPQDSSGQNLNATQAAQESGGGAPPPTDTTTKPEAKTDGGTGQ